MSECWQSERDAVGENGSIDQITLAVIRYKLLAIAEEVVEVMTQTSFSPILNQSRDFSAAILDGDGVLVAQAERVPIHMGALSYAVQAMIEVLGDDLREGDVLVANDPYWGGSHLPDITLAAPLFVEGKPRLWIANRSHHGDIGGISPGGYSPSAREIWQEGIRLPPMKLVEAGVVREDLIRMVCANSRAPSDMRGDLMAQLSSVGRGVERAADLFRRYGTGGMEHACGAILDAGERAMRCRLAEWKQGEFKGVGYLDPFSNRDEPLPVVVKISLEGGAAVVDLRDCGDQLESFLNSPIANTTAAVKVAFMYMLGGEEALNDGSTRAIEVRTRPGSLVDPVEPAPVAACTTLTASVIIEAIMRAMADAAPEQVVAGFARRFRLAISGVDRTGRRFVWHTFANRGGAGAHDKSDGWSNLGVIHNPGGSPSPSIESTEAAYPFHIETYALRPDSGGAGRQRGGLGGLYVLRYEGSMPARITPTGDGVQVAPYGLAGGEDGLPNRYTVVRARQEVELDPKAPNLTLMPGDRIVCRSAGGGGFGRPSDRSWEAVCRDIEYGYVSTAAAVRACPDA